MWAIIFLIPQRTAICKEQHRHKAVFNQASSIDGCPCFRLSRKGMPYDNAVVESFFSSLKQELTHHVRFATLDEARYQIFSYIEVFYNRQRKHSSLGYRSPEQFEQLQCVA